MPCDERERVNYRTMDGVVRAKLQEAQEVGHHLPVVMTVGGAHRGLHLLAKGGTSRFVLAHEVAQRLLADHRIEDRSDDTVRMFHGGFGELVEDGGPAGHLAEVGRGLALGPPPWAGAGARPGGR